MAGVKFTANISGFAFDYGGWTKMFEEYCRKHIRLAARVWLTTVLQNWPVLTGFSKGAFGTLADVVNARITMVGELKRLHDLKKRIEAGKAGGHFKGRTLVTPRSSKPEKGTKAPLHKTGEERGHKGTKFKTPEEDRYNKQQIEHARQVVKDARNQQRLNKINDKINKLKEKLVGKNPNTLRSKLGLKGLASQRKKDLYHNPIVGQKLIGSTYKNITTAFGRAYYQKLVELEAKKIPKIGVKEILAAKKAGLPRPTQRAPHTEARKKFAGLYKAFRERGRYGGLFKRIEHKTYKSIFAYNSYYYPSKGTNPPRKKGTAFKVLKTPRSGRLYSKPLNAKDIFTEKLEGQGQLNVPPVDISNAPSGLEKITAPFVEGNAITGRQILTPEIQKFLTEIQKEKKITVRYGFNFGVNIRYINVIDIRLGGAFARAEIAFINYMKQAMAKIPKIEKYVLNGHSVIYDGVTVPNLKGIIKT